MSMLVKTDFLYFLPLISCFGHQWVAQKEPQWFVWLSRFSKPERLEHSIINSLMGYACKATLSCRNIEMLQGIAELKWITGGGASKEDLI